MLSVKHDLYQQLCFRIHLVTLDMPPPAYTWSCNRLYQALRNVYSMYIGVCDCKYDKKRNHG